jgi:hypothetical protein
MANRAQLSARRHCALLHLALVPRRVGVAGLDRRPKQFGLSLRTGAADNTVATSTPWSSDATRCRYAAILRCQRLSVAHDGV